MTEWNSAELDAVGRAGELRIAGRRTDGTLRKLIIIWAVRVNRCLYVRSANGPDAAWFRGTQSVGAGRIESGGVVKDVTFTRDDSVDEEIDAAYRRKCGSDSAVRAITSDLAISTTLRVDPT